MTDEILYELGVDLNSEFTFVNGDIALCTYNDNLVQGVVNRLKTELDEMDLFYEDYGSILNNFFGWRANETTISFMKSEISNALSQEPRLDSHDCNISYEGDGRIKIELTLYPINGASIDVNLVLGKTGVIELETDEISIGEEE